MKNYVTIDYKHRFEATDWAEANCPGYLTNRSFLNDDGSITTDFYFTTDKNGKLDMLAFKLKFG
jgi:hypothetical protein